VMTVMTMVRVLRVVTKVTVVKIRKNPAWSRDLFYASPLSG
jgi:hypothetical protein